MKVLDPGHRYELASLDGDSAIQTLQFVKREGRGYPGNVGHYPGTTMQEVLRALIDRGRYVYDQIPCWQTGLAIYCMKKAVWALEHRAAKRHGRQPPSESEAVSGEVCKKCNHVGCQGACHA